MYNHITIHSPDEVKTLEYLQNQIIDFRVSEVVQRLKEINLSEEELHILKQELLKRLV